MMNNLMKIKVFAPATTANVAVGFDILGFALDHLGDEVILEKNTLGTLRICSIQSQEKIPSQVHNNTASVALQTMLDFLHCTQGFDIHIIN